MEADPVIGSRSIRLGGEYEFADAPPGEIIRDLLGDVLEEGEDEKLYVREDRAEEVTDFVREMFRQYRSIRRRARLIDEVAKRVDDAELQEAFQSTGGKFVILHSIHTSLRNAQFDGFTMWVNEHFVETDNGLALRDGAEEMVREFLAQVQEINEELKKDDF